MLGKLIIEIAYICDESDECPVTQHTFAPGKPETTQYIKLYWNTKSIKQVCVISNCYQFTNMYMASNFFMQMSNVPILLRHLFIKICGRT